MNFKVSDLIKKIILFIGFCVALILISLITFKSTNNKIISDIKEFIQTENKIIYITNSKNYSKEVIKLLDDYEANYMYVNIDNLDKIDKTRLEKIINSKYLTDIIVIYENGHIVDALIDYENYESLTTFLKQYNVIPKVLKSTKGIKESIESALQDDYTLLYLPYEYEDEIKEQDRILTNICNKYDIKYKKIDTYLLSNNQKEKINKILQISEVDEQIVILIKDKKIVGSIRDEKSRYEYIQELYDFDFVSNKIDIVNTIGVDSFIKIIESQTKNVIVIGQEDCKNCTPVLDRLSEILADTEYTINYINIENIDSDISVKVQNKLNEIEFKEGFTTPIVIITENNKLLDFSIGLASEEYYFDIFKENGIIK